MPLARGIAQEAATLLRLRSSFPVALHPVTRTLTPGAPLPERPPTALAGRMLRKRLRLHPHWKLRPVRRWADFAPLIKDITIRFDPCVEGFVGARELGRQARSSKALAQFPGCAVDVQELDDGCHPMVVVKWVRAKGAVWAPWPLPLAGACAPSSAPCARAPQPLTLPPPPHTHARAGE